jgi:4-amino-4-deoxy-L-arabinose transferase-like glycosyltransferase
MRRFAVLPVLAIGLVEFLVLLVGAGGYGYHRDELYFVEAGQHPAFGYDDQPPLTPLIGRASAALFGQTPTGLRVASALALAVCVVLAGLTARELGGGMRAQVLASASLAASSAMFLGHLLSTATFDFLGWTVLVFLFVRLLRHATPRTWLATGVAAGVTLENKWLVLMLLGSLAGGALAARRADLLRGPWPWLAAAVALAIWAPNLAWQADHGWPQRELSGQIAGEDPLGARLMFLPFQLLIVSPLLAPFWIAGLLWLLRDERSRPFRALGYGYLVLVAVCLATGAKVYYAVGAYPALLGAGGVALESWLASGRAKALAGAAVAISAAVSALIALPIVPARSLGDTPIPDLNEDVVETVGWPAFADDVTRAWRSVPRAERPGAVIFTTNYGEAGAIERFGPVRGLPRAYSGHKSFWSFGRPTGRAGPVVAVGFDRPGYLARFFTGCRAVARIDNGVGVDNEEQGAPIAICAGPRRPWAELWPRLHHLDA